MNFYCICRGTSKVLANSKSKRNLKGCIWWTRQCLHKDGLDSVFTKTLHSNSWHGNVLWPRREGLLWLLEASWEGVILRYHTDSKQMTDRVDRSSGGKGRPDASLGPGSLTGGWRPEQMLLQSSKDAALLADMVQWDSLLGPQHCEKIVFCLW